MLVLIYNYLIHFHLKKYKVLYRDETNFVSLQGLGVIYFTYIILADEGATTKVVSLTSEIPDKLMIPS